MHHYVDRQSQNIIVCSIIVLLHSEIIDFGDLFKDYGSAIITV